MKGRFSLTGFNKFMAIYLAVLAFLLIVVGILDSLACGWSTRASASAAWYCFSGR